MKILLLISVITILLQISCCRIYRSPLTMDKKPYNGNELRTDGYYYSDVEIIESRLNRDSAIYVAVFYKDGFCIHTSIRPKDESPIKYIETQILSGQFNSKFRDVPLHIGVFQIRKQNIEYKIWDGSSTGIITFSYYGEILNDTTFVLKERINNSIQYTSIKNLTYHFKQFSPKPDSTSVFIP